MQTKSTQSSESGAGITDARLSGDALGLLRRRLAGERVEYQRDETRPLYRELVSRWLDDPAPYLRPWEGKCLPVDRTGVRPAGMVSLANPTACSILARGSSLAAWRIGSNSVSGPAINASS